MSGFIKAHNLLKFIHDKFVSNRVQCSFFRGSILVPFKVKGAPTTENLLAGTEATCSVCMRACLKNSKLNSVAAILESVVLESVVLEVNVVSGNFGAVKKYPKRRPFKKNVMTMMNIIIKPNVGFSIHQLTGILDRGSQGDDVAAKPSEVVEGESGGTYCISASISISFTDIIQRSFRAPRYRFKRNFDRTSDTYQFWSHWRDPGLQRCKYFAHSGYRQQNETLSLLVLYRPWMLHYKYRLN